VSMSSKSFMEESSCVESYLLIFKSGHPVIIIFAKKKKKRMNWIMVICFKKKMDKN
jgi:hypothetical protein